MKNCVAQRPRCRPVQQAKLGEVPARIKVTGQRCNAFPPCSAHRQDETEPEWHPTKHDCRQEVDGEVSVGGPGTTGEMSPLRPRGARARPNSGSARARNSDPTTARPDSCWSSSAGDRDPDSSLPLPTLQRHDNRRSLRRADAPAVHGDGDWARARALVPWPVRRHGATASEPVAGRWRDGAGAMERAPPVGARRERWRTLAEHSSDGGMDPAPDRETSEHDLDEPRTPERLRRDARLHGRRTRCVVGARSAESVNKSPPTKVPAQPRAQNAPCPRAR
jgi:hypothetical protein